MKFGFDRPSDFREEVRKWWTDGRSTTDGRTPVRGYTCEPNGSGELKRCKYNILSERKIQIEIFCVCKALHIAPFSR